MDFDITDTAPEHKSGMAARGDYDDFRATFEDFKAANDERLMRLEKKRGDVLLEEKVDRINVALDAQHKRIGRARPETRAAGTRRPRRVIATRRAASTRRVRRLCASGESAGLRALEEKAMSVGSDPDGGYLVPDGDGDTRSAGG